MDTQNFTQIVTLILALSVASERLVEILKSFVPYLNRTLEDSAREARRQGIVQVMSVLSGIVTAYLAKDYLPPTVVAASSGASANLSILGLGLLASGGSSLWNSVLAYLVSIKDIRAAEAHFQKKSAGLLKP